MKQNEGEELPELQLADVTEDATLEAAVPVTTRKKKLVMIGGLLALLGVTAIGGYFLWRGQAVNVNAMRKTPERVTNGSDLQQAAYDSLRGSLSSPPALGAAQNSAANIGSNQTPTIAMAGVTPAPSPSPGATPKPAASIQPGIAMTIAPPPEFVAGTVQTKPAFNQPGAPSTNPNATTATTGNTTVATSKPKTTASIVFASLLVQPAENNGVTTSVHKREPQAEVRGTFPALGEKPLSALPGFGAMLPVRLLGMLYTLRTGALARLELLRDSQAAHWHLPRGTIFVAAVQGAGRDRAYLQVKGLLDPATERFMKLDGEALGSDGATGLRGKERRLSSVWLRVLDRAVQTGSQLLTGLLGRNGSQVIIAADPAGLYRSATNSESTSMQNSRSFVEVPAGTVGFILVTTLPAPTTADAPSTKPNETLPTALSDGELAELFSTNDRAKIRAALPRMSPEVRRAVEQTLQEMER